MPTTQPVHSAGSRRGHVDQECNPPEVSREDAEICPTCDLQRPVSTKLQSKPVRKVVVRTNTNIHYVNVSSASGKVGTKELNNVRSHLMRRVHRLRVSREQEMMSVRGSEMCLCDHWTKSERVMKITHQIQSSLGAGRCDPFLRLQVPNVPKRYHELMDYCMATLWTGLRSSEYSIAYARKWLSLAAQNPVVLHVLLFAASSHLEALRGDEVGSDAKKKVRMEQLQQKGEAIRGIRDAMKGGNYSDSDEMIQSILFLALNETSEVEEPADWSPFPAPLRNLQWLNIYGTRTYFMPHVVAVQNIIEKRGGVRKIHTIGLAWLISCSELIFCAATLGQPQHALLDPLGQDIHYCPFDISNYPLELMDQSDTGSLGFLYLQMFGLHPEIVTVFLRLRDYSQAIEFHEDRVVLPECMADNRNWVLQGVLSLPSASTILHQVYALSEDTPRIMSVYEACRLAAIMYCIHVAFPTPRSHHARMILLPLMKEAILKIDLQMAIKPLLELITWCVVIGGIAASEQDARSWFLTQRDMCSANLELSEWSELKVIMRQFAWVDSACDPGGERLWNEII